MERGLSRNTVAAYRRDLTRYTEWCAARGIASADAVAATDLADFTVDLARGGDGRAALGPGSVARCVVAVRGFHRFCLLEGVTTSDPARAWRPPKTPRRLPKAIPYDRVVALIAAAGAAEPHREDD